MKNGIVFAICFALWTTAAGASAPCADPGHAQFDFWIGTWRVTTPDGRHAGDNTITRIHGCALREEWRGASGFTGSSLNLWDSTTKRWHQTWVDSSGTLLRLDGGIENGSMRMTGDRIGRDGRTIRDRITWTPLDAGRVRQLWEQSAGDGEWKVVFDGTYERK